MRYTEMLTFRGEPGDAELLRTAAEEAGQSRSRFLREAALGRALETLSAQEDGKKVDVDRQQDGGR